MNREEYIKIIRSDAQEYIDENYKDYENFDEIWDDILLTVTGNDNGSYYCNSFKARQAISGVIFDDDVNEACKELGYENGIPVEKGPEACDVIVRYALIQDLHDELESYYGGTKYGD